MPFIAQTAPDAYLDDIAASNELILVSGSLPTTFAAANSAALARASLAPADFTKAAGDVSGRKLTMAGKTTMGEANGTATHFALVHTGTSTLRLANTMTNVAITNGQPQDTNPVRVVEVEDPS